MTTADTRRAALRALIADQYDGVARRLAMAAKKPDGQINDMLADPPRKAFGEKVARQLEEALGLEVGFFDRTQSAEQPATHQVNEPAALYEFSPPQIKELASVAHQLSGDRQRQVIAFAKALLVEQFATDKNQITRAGQ